MLIFLFFFYYVFVGRRVQKNKLENNFLDVQFASCNTCPARYVIQSSRNLLLYELRYISEMHYILVVSSELLYRKFRSIFMVNNKILLD